MTDTNFSAQVLDFPIKSIRNKKADEDRLYRMYYAGEITKETFLVWLKAGGHI